MLKPDFLTNLSLTQIFLTCDLFLLSPEPLIGWGSLGHPNQRVVEEKAETLPPCQAILPALPPKPLLLLEAFGLGFVCTPLLTNRVIEKTSPLKSASMSKINRVTA